MSDVILGNYWVQVGGGVRVWEWGWGCVCARRCVCVSDVLLGNNWVQVGGCGGLGLRVRLST